MKSKILKFGVILLLLIVMLPVFLYFTHTGEKDNPPKQSMKQEKLADKQKDDAVSAAKKTEKASAPAIIHKETSSSEADGKNVAASSGATKAEQSNFIVVIDPGHQVHANTAQEPVGPGSSVTKMKVTGGTSGVATGMPEYKLTLEASLLLGQLLERRGVKVIYTRTTNEVNISNSERAEVANQNHADLFVRIHADGSTDRNVHGLSVLTPSANDPYTKAIFNDSLKASQLIINNISKNSAVKENGISYRDDMAGFNWSQVPCTLIELGFMTNPTEDKNLSNQVYLKNLMTNIADGIIQYESYKK